MMYKEPEMASSNVKNCCLLCATLFSCPLSLPAYAATRSFPAQTAVTVSQVKKIYVDSLGDKKGAKELRDALIGRLRRSHEIQVVDKANEADAVITGNAEVWVKGYYSTNPRPSKFNEIPIYGGFLSVELKGKGDETLWSYLVTPGKLQWNGITQDLTGQLTKKLLETLHKGGEKAAAN
jgi:hypothetical protein